MGSKRKTTTQIVAKIDPRWASELEKTACQVNGGGRDGLQGNSLLLRTDRNPSNFNIWGPLGAHLPIGEMCVGGRAHAGAARAIFPRRRPHAPLMGHGVAMAC